MSHLEYEVKKGDSLWKLAGNYLKDQLPLLGLDHEWIVAHPAVGSGWRTKISLYNPHYEPQVVTLRCHSDVVGSADYLVNIQPFAHQEIDIAGSLWGISEAAVNEAWLSLHAEVDFAGFMSYEYGADSSASLPFLPIHNPVSRNLPQIASDSYWWTGLVFINCAETDQEIKLTAYAANGDKLEEVKLNLGPEQKLCDAVGAFFSPETIAQRVSSLSLEQAENVSAVAIFGTMFGANRISAVYW